MCYCSASIFISLSPPLSSSKVVCSKKFSLILSYFCLVINWTLSSDWRPALKWTIYRKLISLLEIKLGHFSCSKCSKSWWTRGFLYGYWQYTMCFGACFRGKRPLYSCFSGDFGRVELSFEGCTSWLRPPTLELDRLSIHFEGCRRLFLSFFLFDSGFQWVRFYGRISCTVH